MAASEMAASETDVLLEVEPGPGGRRRILRLPLGRWVGRSAIASVGPGIVELGWRFRGFNWGRFLGELQRLGQGAGQSFGEGLLQGLLIGVLDIGGVDIGGLVIEGVGLGRELEFRFDMGRFGEGRFGACLLYTSPSPRDATLSRMPSSA